MIRHIVSWKLAAEDAATKLEHSAQIAAALQGLVPIIPEIISLSVHNNIAYPGDNFDLVLVADYESLEALDAYQVHTEHQRVAAFITSLAESRAKVDFEV